MEWLSQYGLFLAKALTVVFSCGLILLMMLAVSLKRREHRSGVLEIKKLNDKFDNYNDQLNECTLNKQAYKIQRKQKKQSKRKQEKNNDDTNKRLFVIKFDGDISASNLPALRESINAILTTATPDDEVLVLIDSAGGLMHAYGLAASQLVRVRQHNIRLTVAIDKIAASGGYLMAAVADQIIAAPFAIIGSIGVVAQLPNFNRLLHKHDIDYEQFTAGQHKRTVTLFGKNTDAAREKFSQDITAAHQLFKDFLQQYRPQLDIAAVATGEHWQAIRALDLKLVDILQTSDDYLLNASKHTAIFSVTYREKRSLGKRLGNLVHNAYLRFNET